MGLWKRLGRLRKRPEQEEKQELESMSNAEQESLTEQAELNHHLEVIVDSTFEMEDLKREYEMVTSYFSDIQKIEQMEPGSLQRLEEDAGKILMLEERKNNFQQTPKQLPAERYRLILRLEPEIPEAIHRLEELENMRGKIKRDLEYLEGEKGALQYEEENLQHKQSVLRNAAIAIGVILVLTVVACLIVTLQFDIELTVPGAAVAAALLVVEFFLFLNYNQANTERSLCFQKHNRAIQLQNKVKIKWLNNTNNLDYLYAKYEVNTQKELSYDWEQYCKIREEEQKYQKNMADLNVYQEEVLTGLKKAGVYDAEIWLQQLEALVDKREMVEVKHSLNVRRQKLRERMKQNEESRQNSFVCVKGILTEHPELKEQAKEVLTSYHIAV